MGMMVLVISAVTMIVVMMAVVVIMFVRMTADLYVAATKSASTFFAHINSVQPGTVLNSTAPRSVRSRNITELWVGGKPCLAHHPPDFADSARARKSVR